MIRETEDQPHAPTLTTTACLGVKCDRLDKAVADQRRQQQQQNPKRITGDELAHLFAQHRCHGRASFM